MNKTEVINQITIEILKRIREKSSEAVVPVGVSNRHIHLEQDDLETLFGKGYQLTKKKGLKQPGQFAAKETVMIIGPKGIIDKVRILGPVRNLTQIEISQTDSYKLGVKAPVRESGKIDRTPGIVIKGPKGVLEKNEGVIVARRHIHLDPLFAEKCGLKDQDKVQVQFSGSRGLTLDQVLIRVSENYIPEIHIDTDEANAGMIQNGALAKIVIEK